VCVCVFHQLFHLCLHSMNMTDHRRSPQVMFYAIGLGHEDTDTFDPHLDSYVKKKTTWKIRTLQSLLRQHNHTEVGMLLRWRQQEPYVEGNRELQFRDAHRCRNNILTRRLVWCWRHQERCVGRKREL